MCAELLSVVSNVAVVVCVVAVVVCVVAVVVCIFAVVVCVAKESCSCHIQAAPSVVSL